MSVVKYCGHSTFLLDLNGKTILIDPWLSNDAGHDGGRRLVPAACAERNIRSADLILISHEHLDHCDALDVKAIETRTAAQVLAPEDALARLEIPARMKVPVSEGDSFTISGVDVVVTNANHPQSSHPVGFIVSRGSKSIYFAGDTYDFYDMVSIDVDLAMLPIGGTFTMDVLGAVSALKRMRAKYAIPMHYNTFPRISADPRDFERRTRTFTKTQPVILSPGEKFDL